MEDNTICLFDKNQNPLCLPTKAFSYLQEIVKNKFNLQHLPTINEIKHYLNIKNKIEIEKTVERFLKKHGYVGDINTEFKVQVPTIDYYGLSGMNLIKIFDKLQKYYKYFHYRGPCLLDFISSSQYNYSDLKNYPIFKQNNNEYSVYYILLLNIPITTKHAGHWIGITVCENAIFYYDSLNEKIKKEFVHLLNIISLYLKVKYKKVLYWRNNKQIQLSGKHCGVFQVHFISTILSLYENNKLFIMNTDNDNLNNNGNNIDYNLRELNINNLNHYLQDKLTQDIIEKTVTDFFYINI